MSLKIIKYIGQWKIHSEFREDFREEAAFYAESTD